MNHEDQIKEWLMTQFVDGYYISHKAALIASCDPYGLISDYKDKQGNIYGYLNGELQTYEASSKIRLD
jgi:hypothetical protein